VTFFVSLGKASITAEELQRTADWNDFINEANSEGYPLPTDLQSLSESGRHHLCKEFVEWQNQKAAEQEFLQLYAEADHVNYQPMPSVDFHANTDDDLWNFKTGLFNWKKAKLALGRSAMEAKDAGYAIPNNFSELTMEQQGALIKGYTHWKDERAHQVQQFIDTATAEGFSVPHNLATMRYNEQMQIHQEYESWAQSKEQALSIAPFIPLPSADEAMKEIMRDRKSSFKPTADADEHRQGRSTNQAGRRKQNRAQAIDKKRRPQNNQEDNKDTANDATPQLPPRRSSQRNRRASLRMQESNGEQSMLQSSSPDSFEMKLDRLSNQFQTDVLGEWNQLQSDVVGFGSFDEEEYDGELGGTKNR